MADINMRIVYERSAVNLPFNSLVAAKRALDKMRSSIGHVQIEHACGIADVILGNKPILAVIIFDRDKSEERNYG